MLEKLLLKWWDHDEDMLFVSMSLWREEGHVIIASGNGLVPNRHQAITWTSDEKISFPHENSYTEMMLLFWI